MSYSLADWRAGTPPAKGWDCADALADGWSAGDFAAFMRATLSDILPAFGAARPAPVPEATDALADMPAIGALAHGSEVFIAQTFAQKLLSVFGGKVVRADGGFWAFGPTAWREIPELRLRLALHRFDGAVIAGKQRLKLGRRMIDGVLSETGAILSEPEFFDRPALALNARNGVITIGTDGRIGTRPHSADDRFRFTIPADFDLSTDMTPPENSLLGRLLAGAFSGDADANDKIALVGEILGAAAFGLATRLRQPKAFVFLGETASNGKSTIASLLACLLPEGAVSAIPPSAYEDERRIINLAGKAANVADELSASAIAGETFKAAVTGNKIEGRDLYRSAMTFVPRAIHVFTTNTLPRFSGGLDRGLQRRLVVLRFNRTIPDNEVIPDIAERIRNEELSSLLGFAIAGAQRLFRNHGYTIPPSSTEALQFWLRLDPVNEWFAECITVSAFEPVGGWLRTSELFRSFRAWAIEQGHGERFLPPVNTFSQRLKVFPGLTLKHRSAGTLVIGAVLRRDTATVGGEALW